MEFEKIRYLRIILIVFLFYNQATLSQNLVPNPSFEEFLDFKTDNKSSWHKLQNSDTPDYFNFGNAESSNNIFNEYIGGTYPKSGVAFVGIFCLRINPHRNIKNIREFIESPLTKHLEKDSVYKIELSLFLDEESNIAIKNFGILFSESTMQSDNDLRLFAIKPQIEFNSSFLDNRDNWITLQAFYKAAGTEKYLVIGNFRSDKTAITKKNIPAVRKGKREKWGLSQSEKASYYSIDDVVVEKVTIQNEIQLSEETKTPVLQDTFKIEEIGIDSAIILNNVFFEFNKYDLLPGSNTEINKLNYLMSTNPAIKIRIEGHTDNIGSYQFNLNLSLKRVESVANYLISKGINPQRIELAAFSYNYPIASNQSEEGRKQNRRVAFKITEK